LIIFIQRPWPTPHIRELGTWEEQWWLPVMQE
jgi:hypothetical protein